MENRYDELVTKLYEEQKDFLDRLRAEGVDSVISHAYEISLREDLIYNLDYISGDDEFDPEVCAVLCETPNLLERLVKRYGEQNYSSYNDTLIDVVRETGEAMLKEQSTRHLYVDMDGVLAVFNNQIESEEVLYQEGYYRDLPPQENVVEAVNILCSMPHVEVYILSAVLPSPYAKKEKVEWLNKYLPGIDAEHRIFVPCGDDKGQYIGHALGENDLLLDDYSKNLHAWCPPGNAIKLMNDINGHYGTWKGATVHYKEDPNMIAHKILAKFSGDLEMEQETPAVDAAKGAGGIKDFICAFGDEEAKSRADEIDR